MDAKKARAILNASDFVEYLADHNHYQDAQGNDWYVPRQEILCGTCNGTGDFGVTGEYVECPICFGECVQEIEHFDLMLSAEEYHSERRQQLLLVNRYGYIPSKISDYWTKSKA